MLTFDEVSTYQVPGLPRLNEQQINFFVATMNGVPLVAAWRQFYATEGNINSEIASTKTKKITDSLWYKKYKEYYEGVVRTRCDNEIGWNKQLSIAEHKRLYSLNLVEVERLAAAHDKAIEYYTKKKEQAIEDGNDKLIEKYEERIIKELKAKNMAIASNQACIDSLDALDKIAGLQTINVNNTTANINFFGHNMWGD